MLVSSILTILTVWSVVSSQAFQSNSMVNAVASNHDTLYVGGLPGNVIHRYIYKGDGSFCHDVQSEQIASPTSGVKEIVVNGDYLYVCSRDNGYGLNVDYKRPDYLASFEEGLGFESVCKANGSVVEVVDEPCPSRWQKSLHLSKKSGDGDILLSQSVPVSNDKAEFALWVKVRSLEADVTVPLLEDLLSIKISKSGCFGLSVRGKSYKGSPLRSGRWVNLKVLAGENRVTLYAREEECPAAWTELCSARIGGFQYDKITVGLSSIGEADILIDEFAYCHDGIDEKTSVNGTLAVVDRSTLKLLNRYTLDLRCLSMIQDGNLLYLGMIGGLNVYDVSNPQCPKLIGTFREAMGRLWDYPQKGESAYHFKVPGQEFQRMDIMTLPNGSKIIAGGCDTHGVVLVDISNPYKPVLYKHLYTTPLVDVKGGRRKQKYIEWGVACDYPYVYSSVASVHSLVHNQYFSGKLTAESWTPDIYGIKVYDISDPGQIRDTLILVPKEYFPTHIAKEGDSCPNQITRQGDCAFLNFSEHGVAKFKLDGFNSSFDSMIHISDKSRVRYTHLWGNKLVVGDGAVFGPWTECNLSILADPLPEYYSGYIEPRRAAIHALAKDQADGFYFWADTHCKSNSLNAPRLISYLSDGLERQKVLWGGDAIPSFVQDVMAMWDMQRKMNRSLFHTADVYNVRGNHDFTTRYEKGGHAGETFSQERTSNLLAESMNGSVFRNPADKSSCYYYFDSNGIRYLVFDGTDRVEAEDVPYGNKAGIGAVQLDWMLSEGITKAPANTRFVVVCHEPIARSLDKESYYANLLTKLEEIQARDHSILFVLAGHIHHDMQVYENGILHITIASDAKYQDFKRAPLLAGDPSRKLGTWNENAIDYISISKDYSEVNCIRVGAGHDRKYLLSHYTVSEGAAMDFSPLDSDAGWSICDSRGDSVAFVSAEGMLTARNEGSTIVVATHGDRHTFYCVDVPPSKEKVGYKLLRTYKCPESTQGVAVSSNAFYGIGNMVVSKRALRGELLIKKDYADTELIHHFDGGIVVDGLLYCSHSNFPDVPMASSIEIFDPETLQHLQTISLGIDVGSCTWIVPGEDCWYLGFAHYDNTNRSTMDEADRNNYWSQIVRFDKNWQRTGGWIIPREVMDLLKPYSISGALYLNGRFYCTGHNLEKLFVLEFPPYGMQMVLAGTIDIPFKGQGIAIDHEGNLWGIDRDGGTVMCACVDLQLPALFDAQSPTAPARP